MSEMAHWPRWIRASCAKYFDTNKGTYTLFVEGEKRDTDEEANLVEFRLDGPDIQEQSRNYYHVYVEINLFVQSVMNDNLWEIDTVLGYFADLFGNINVFRYGDGVGDDDSLVGCLRLITSGKEAVLVNTFGQVRPDSQIQQATIEGHFEMWLTL